MKTAPCQNYFLLAALVLLAGLAVPGAHAADTTTSAWSGANSTTWSDTGNWGSGVPSSTVSALFNSTFANQPNLTAGATAQGIWLASSVGQDVTIGAGSAFTLQDTGTATLNSVANAGIYMNDSANHNLNIGANVTVQTVNTTGFYNNQSSGALNFLSGSTLNFNTRTITVGTVGTASGAVNISGAISTGSGAFTLKAGTLTLNPTSTGHSYNINVGAATGDAGTLKLASANAVDSSGTFTFGPGTVLNTLGTPITSPMVGKINTGNSIGSLTYGQAGDTSANNLTFTGAGTIYQDFGNGSANVQTINGTGVTLSLNLVWTNSNGGGRTLTVNGPGNTLVLAGLGLGGSGTTATQTQTISGSGNLTINGVINDGLSPFAESLKYSGTGILTLLGANTYTGGTTTIGTGSTASTLQLGNGGATGSLPTGSAIVINSGAALVINRNNPVAQGTDFCGAAITGAGSLTQAGSSTLTLSGANTFTGGVKLNGGTANAGIAQTGTTSGPFGASGTISFGGGTLQYSSVNQQDYSSRFSTAASQPVSIDLNGTNVTFATGLTSSGGTLTVTSSTGNGVLTLTGTSTYTGNTVVGSGALLTIGSAGKLGGGNYAGNLTNNGAFTYGSSAAQTLGGVISGSGVVTNSGSGTLTLNGNNTFTNPIVITAGTVSVAAIGNVGVAGPLGAAPAGVYTNAPIQILMGAVRTLQYTGSGETNNRSIYALQQIATGNTVLDASGSGPLVFNSATNLMMDVNNGSTGDSLLTLTGSNTGGNTMAGDIQDQVNGGKYLAVIKQGAGTWLLQGAKSFRGRVDVTGGTLKFDSLANAGTACALGLATQLYISTTASGYAISLTNGGVLQYTGTGTSTSDRIIGLSGNGTLSDGTAGGSLTLNGVVTNLNANGNTLTLAGSGNSAIAGNIVDNFGGLGVTKTGSGTWTLSGANNYEGTTTVSNGTLLVNGNSGGATNTFTVSTGAALGGNGIIGGATTVNAGGVIFAGTNGIGTLTVSSNLTLNAVSTNRFVVTTGGASNQVVVAGGTLTPNSSIIEINTASTQLGIGTNVLFTYIPTQISGSFTATPVFDTVQTGAATNALIVNDGAGHIVLAIANPTPPLSTNAWLTGLVISNSTSVLALSPSFTTNGFAYTATNVFGGGAVTVLVTNADNTATNTLLVGTTAVQPLTNSINSAPQTLGVGTTNVTVQVMSQDLSVTNNYVVAVTQLGSPVSSDASLSYLAVTPGTLSPVFASGTTNYAVTNAYAGSQITVAVTNNSTFATNVLYLNGAAQATNAGSLTVASLPVGVGSTNLIDVQVTAQDGLTVSNYFVTVTRLGSTNALLSGLSISPGALSQAFSSGLNTYTATNTYPATNVTVTATSADGTAGLALSFNTSSIYGIPLTNGVASVTNTMSLGSPANVLAVQVVSQDLSQTNVYTVNELLQPSLSVPHLTNSVSGNNLVLSWAADHLGYRLLVQTNNLNKGVSGNSADWGTVSGTASITATNIGIIKSGVTNEYYKLTYP